MAAALQRHAATHGAIRAEVSDFGVCYIVKADLDMPDGKGLYVRGVWQLDHGARTVRFITAYPLGR